MSRLGSDLSETFQDFLTGCAKTVMLLGALATFISVGLLVFTCFRVTGDAGSASQMADAVRNAEIFQKVLIAGVIGLATGSAYMFWGSEFLGAAQLVVAAGLYFAPLYLPGMLSGTNQASQSALGSLQVGGTIL